MYITLWIVFSGITYRKFETFDDETARFFHKAWNWKSSIMKEDIAFTNTYYKNLKGVVINAYNETNHIIGTISVNKAGLGEISNDKFRLKLIQDYRLSCFPFITNLVVDKKYRNQKVGSTLVQYAINECSSYSTHAFILCDMFNKNAIRLYRRMKFEYVGNDVPFICMVKKCG